MADLPALRYCRPHDLGAALAAIARPGACIYAGGTDLLVALGERRPWTRFVRTIVDVKTLGAAHGITRYGRGLRIGALTTAHELATDPVVSRHAPALAEAARATAAPALRRRGTVGGNLVTPHPAADVTTALLALGATVEVAAGRRVLTTTLPAFLARQAVEWPRQRLILAVHVPAAPHSAFEKISARVAFGRALVAVAIAVGGRGPHVALGGMAARPGLATATAAALRRGTPLAAALAADCPPPRDVRATHRMALAGVLVERTFARVRA